MVLVFFDEGFDGLCGAVCVGLEGLDVDVTRRFLVVINRCRHFRTILLEPPDCNLWKKGQWP
jgi:hypothetical protein